ncbi:MAG: GAF domain-containing protein, partial [Alphaproteobacteria bacterium]|nr:GAF domain-containing protein [Alphaproteobacteria bacterium]
MQSAPIPNNEESRLERLRLYRILDTPPEDAFDRIVRIIAETIDVPIALVSLVDSERQWFKSKYGL